MPIEIVKGSSRIKQNEKFHVSQNDIFLSTKKVKNCKGKWYFEFKHFAGGTNYNCIGFALGIEHILFYPWNTTIPYFAMSQKLNKGTTNTPMPFKLEKEYTVGLGIDVAEHKFYVFYNNYFDYYDFNAIDDCNELNVKVWGSVSDQSDDYISLNFGDTPFKYDITAFTPWSKVIKKVTCNNIRRNDIYNSIFLFVLLSIST